MATTVTRMNHTEKLLRNGEVTFANLKFMLRDSATVDATHTVVSDLTDAEVSGNGWTAGGESLANAAVTVVVTSGSMIDADSIAVTATGGDIGPSPAGYIIDATNADPVLLYHHAFPTSQTAGTGTEFQVNLNTSGISRSS